MAAVPVISNPSGCSSIAARANGTSQYQQWLAWAADLFLPESSLILLDQNLLELGWHGDEKPAVDSLAALARQCQQTGGPVSATSRKQEKVCLVMASNTHPQRFLMLASPRLNAQQKTAAFKVMSWALHSVGLDDLSSSNQDLVQPALELIDTPRLITRLQNCGHRAQAHHFINELQNVFNCREVSLAIKHTNRIKVLAISGQLHVDPHRAAVKAIASDLTQHLEGHHPNPSINTQSDMQLGRARITEAGEQLIVSIKSECGIWLVQLKIDGQSLLRRLDKEKLANCIGTPLLLFSALYKTATVTYRSRLVALLPGINYTQTSHRVYRLPVLIMVIASLLLLIAPIDHRVTASASIEASDKQVMVAPLDGIIESVHVRAGDRVTTDQLLARLDTGELQLELQKWQSEYDQARRDQQQALATHDRVKLGAAQSRLALITAEIEQLNQMIRRHEIRAPFDSLVLSGDWHDALGASIQSGDVLFELAAGDQHRLVMEIPERHISRISVGQDVRLRMTGLPDQVIQAGVQRILPVASAERGSNHFRVYASIAPASGSLQPGMEGVAKVLVGRRSLVSQWMFSLTERLTVVAWKVGLLL